MSQDYNNYNNNHYHNNYGRNERPPSPPPQQGRPRWQNGGYFPYNSPQRRPPAPAPPEIRTPPGLAHPAREIPSREAPHRAAPPVALEPRPEYQEYQGYHGNPPSHPAVPNYHVPAQPEPQYGRHAPTREQYAYTERPKRGGTVLRVIGLILLCALIAGGVGALVTQMFLRDWEATHMSGAEEYAPTETHEPVPEETQNPGGVLTATEIAALGREQVVSIRAEVESTDTFGRPTTRLATGTGFILTADGYILTNYHVVEGARSIVVAMEDGREFEAAFLGGDFVTSDVAVLRIAVTGLSPVTIGRAADLRVGESIFAIGNPLELQHSISAGIVSALDREVSLEQGPLISMFQIDASVNPGNSGGPVYNELGEVVGIVTAKATIDGVEGIGFAIPIEDAMRYVQRIIQGGGQEQDQNQDQNQGQTQGNEPWLGISPVTVTDSQAEEFGLVIGVFTNGIYPNTAAERGGMQVGDIITAFSGVPVRTVEDLRDAIARYTVGDIVNLTVWRAGEIIQVSITLAGRPAEQ